MEYSFQRYLQAKRTVDDRALNRVIWQLLQHQLLQMQASQPIQVLEIGSGIGTMLHRLVEWDGLDRGTYLGIDSDHDNVTYARHALIPWAEQHELTSTRVTGGCELNGPNTQLRAAFCPLDIAKYLESPTAKDFDLVIANAFLDLVDPAELLPEIGKVVKPGGLGWFTINFDGLTAFEPIIDPSLDATIIHLYHQSMDERREAGHLTGGSRTGRHLYQQLTSSGWEVLAVGASDWIVHSRAGNYQSDEAYFLQHLLHFFEQTLTGHPTLKTAAFNDWLAARRAQINGGKLMFIAHQLDYLVRWTGG